MRHAHRAAVGRGGEERVLHAERRHVAAPEALPNPRDERGALGMHYTSVPNILKVLNPLFLDDLRQQLEEADDNVRMLLNLRKRMSKIRVFDPACGSGNFLDRKSVV
mgnify:CR=1 FL=1